MKDIFIFTTSLNNHYTGNFISPYYLFLTPIILYFLEHAGSEDYKYKLPKELFLGKERYTENEIKYYYHKYCFLKKNNLLENRNTPGIDKTSGLISEDKIKLLIANLRCLTFEVTDACNLKCKYCGYGELYTDYDKRENHYLKFETAKSIIDYLVDIWNSSLNHTLNRKVFFSFYGGEPLLNFKLIKKIIEYLEKVCPQFIIKGYSMTTNGTLLNKHMDYLVEKNFQILISMDGNESNHSYRVTHRNINSFKTVTENINLLKQKFPAFFSSNVSFNSVLHNRNSVREIVDFFRNEYDKTAYINGLNAFRVAPDKNDEFKKMYKNFEEDIDLPENYYQLLSKPDFKNPYFRKAAVYFHQTSHSIIKKYNELFLAPNTGFIPTATCLPFSKKMFVTVNGKILPCERIGHKHYFGKVTDNSVEINCGDIAEKYNKSYKQIQKYCCRCYGYLICQHCMFHLRKTLDDKLFCPDVMSIGESIAHFSNILSFIEKNPKIYKIITDVELD